jgi:hypothetical protein
VQQYGAHYGVVLSLAQAVKETALRLFAFQSKRCVCE